MIRQAVLAALLSLLPFRSALIPVSVLFMLIFNLSLVMHYMPHVDPWDNRLDASLMLLAVLGYQGSVVISRDLGNETTVLFVDGARVLAYILIGVANIRVVVNEVRELTNLRRRKQLQH